ncbi:DUF262 domain-containing protein [Streptomyces sp. NPDC006365]|uniref:DUF262 domain-containing protein n=1 Tax=Streptomyces sp. NPDC006365 TaxID=3364744 RepID=UPI0036CA6E72
MAGLENDADPRGALFERPVEIGANGRPTGVELELPPDEPDRLAKPLDWKSISIETESTTVDVLMSRLRAKALDLAPDFHRRAGMWSDVQQSRFIESLLLGLPVAPFHMAQQEDDTWSVVDGSQRLTAIARLMIPGFAELPPLTLRGLEYLPQYEGLTHLRGRMQVRVLETQVVVHIVRHGTPDAVKFNVFSRLTTGGSPLTPQEIRHAMIPGPARSLLADLAENPAFGEATGFDVSNERMHDRELVLRFLAFRLTPPAAYRDQDFELFLTDAMHRLNALTDKQRHWEAREFREAMRCARTVFGGQAFRRSLGHRRKLPLNKALFDAVAVNIATLDDRQRDVLVTSRDEVRDGLSARLTGDFAFERALTVAPGDPGNVRTRFEVVARLFQGVLSGD